MKQPVPYEKMSKKQRREENAKRRGTWKEINPVTRRVESAKVYQRAKLKRQRNDSLPSFFPHFWQKMPKFTVFIVYLRDFYVAFRRFTANNTIFQRKRVAIYFYS